MTVASSDSVAFRRTAETDLAFVMAVEHEAAAERFVGRWERRRHAEALSEAGELHLIVESRETGEPVGFILLAGIGSPDDSVEFKRIVIGPKNRGFGRQAVKLLKRYVFEDLHAHRLWLDVKDFNRRARMLYASEGFIEEGTLRECVRASAGFESLVTMAMLESDYRRKAGEHAAMASQPATSEESRLHHLRLVQRFYEEMWNRFDVGVFPELLEPDITFRGSLGQEKHGYSGLREYVAFIQGAFPDFHNHIQDVVADGTNAFARLLYSGTHQGEVFGIRPNGRRFEYSGAALFAFRAARISSVWVLGDIHGLMQQLQD